MADQAKVKIGVDASGYDTEFNRIKASADGLFREMIKSSRQYTTSAKEVLSDIESQIKAIERRNRIEAEGRRSELSKGRATGVTSESEYRRGVTELKGDTQTDKLQIQLLRELIETTKQTAKDQIKEDRVAVEKQIAASETVNKRAPKGDEQAILRETIQQAELGKLGQEEIAQKSRFEAARKGLPYMSAVAGSSNFYEAVAHTGQMGMGKVGQMGGALGLLGGLGAIGMMVGGRAIQASLPYEQAMGRVAGISGGTVSGSIGHEGTYEQFGRGFQDYGYTMDEALSRRADITRARGYSGGAGKATLDALLMERGLGLDSGLINQMESTQRGETSGLSTRGIVQGTIGAFRSTGAIRGQDMAALPQYLQMANQIGQEQLKALGRVDTGINTKMVAGISGMHEALKNPQYLSGVVASLRAGLVSAPNEQTEALQYATLSRMNPSGSLFDLTKTREKGQYLPQYLSNLKNISGGGDQYKFSLMSQFGLSAQAAEDVAGGDIEKLKRTMASKMGTEGGVNLEGRAGGATGTLTANIAKWTNGFMQTGKDIVDAFNSFTAGLDDVLDEIKKVVDAVQEHQRETFKAADEIGKTNDTMSLTEKALRKSAAALTNLSGMYGGGLGRR